MNSFKLYYYRQLVGVIEFWGDKDCATKSSVVLCKFLTLSKQDKRASARALTIFIMRSSRIKQFDPQQQH